MDPSHVAYEADVMRRLEGAIASDAVSGGWGKPDQRLVRIDKIGAYPATMVRCETVDRDGVRRVSVSPIWDEMFLLPNGDRSGPGRVAGDINLWARGA